MERPTLMYAAVGGHESTTDAYEVTTPRNASTDRPVEGMRSTANSVHYLPSAHGRIYVCEICKDQTKWDTQDSFTFPDELQFQYHVVTVHRGIPVKDMNPSDETRTCTRCNIAFRSASTYQVHKECYCFTRPVFILPEHYFTPNQTTTSQMRSTNSSVGENNSTLCNTSLATHDLFIPPRDRVVENPRSFTSDSVSTASTTSAEERGYELMCPCPPTSDDTMVTMTQKDLLLEQEDLIKYETKKQRKVSKAKNEEK